MPVSPSAFAALVQTNVNTRLQSVGGYSPLSQRNSAYFIEFCTAIGTGIILGAPSILFTTTDSGFEGTPPVPGTGVGIGIVTDPTFFIQDLYTRIRNYVIADFNASLHQPYPPSSGNSGEYLLAICKGINDAFLAYYPIAWGLVSSNPQIYSGTGTIANGQFSGVMAPAIKSAIVSAAPNFIGIFWPTLAQAISESYAALIEQHSTGMVTVTGSCVPGVSQICNVSGSGTGTGVAT